jgi:hypothetical protein
MRTLVIKLIAGTFFCPLILTAASAGEWEVFTGTLNEYEKYNATQNMVEFKNGIEVSGRDELFEKPVIKNRISFGGTSKHVDPEIVDLASELMLEGYSDFILTSSVLGGKSLLAIKGLQQTKLGLSSDYSVIRADTRLDKNGDGKFERSEIISEHAQENLNKSIGKVKERYDAKREKLKEKRLPNQSNGEEFAGNKGHDGSNSNAERNTGTENKLRRGSKPDHKPETNSK